MTAEEYLDQVKKLDHQISVQLDVLSSLRDMALKVTSVMQEDVVSRTRDPHQFDGIMAKIVDLEKEIDAIVDELVDHKRDVARLILKIEDPQIQDVLHLYYIGYRSWKEIADMKHISKRTVYRCRDAGLKRIEELLSETT